MAVSGIAYIELSVATRTGECQVRPTPPPMHIPFQREICLVFDIYDSE